MASTRRDARPWGPGAREMTLLGSSVSPENNRTAKRLQAELVRLPIFRDGVFVGNDFVPISPRLRARIREMAMEARR